MRRMMKKKEVDRGHGHIYLEEGFPLCLDP
jgi:hypothetical protein